MTLTTSYRAAIISMELTGPKPLHRRAATLEEDENPAEDVSPPALRAHLGGSGPDDPLRTSLHLALARWDSADDSASWTDGTAPHTDDRRRTVYQLLAVDEDTRNVLDSTFPRADDGSVVISTDFEPWYGSERKDEHAFYWPAYRNHLEGNGWPGDALANLDVATSRVVERLSDPTRAQAFQAKGLVVGYVQSGKTANFTGVIAKAIDAGYRLVIVLTGTIDLLRKQTQRRLDMELVGVENIFGAIDPDGPDVPADADYVQDQDRIDGKFLAYTFRPSDHGFADVVRLTRHGSDYKSLNAGITALEIQKRVRQKPLYEAENLFNSDARLAVVKKNASVLKRLVRDLNSIQSHLGEIPTLIIDDESDQASVNTSNPTKWRDGQTERTAINKLISELLGLLPRAQYVGYTATPYANVFVDPSDSEDIFPKDFLLSLERPAGYMGIADFHDLDLGYDDTKTVQNSNEKALVRDLWGHQGSPEAAAELAGALDAFLLSGALKLYRQAHGVGTFRHHTMLVHESVRMIEHKELATLAEDLWRGAGHQTAAGARRLADLLHDDFRPVHAARAPELPFPDHFDELKPFVGQALTKMEEAGGHPVMIVNGDKDIQRQDLDFEARPVWRVLVGGAKLSRGFTVEGLTVSYYRRRTQQADTLMQMGRWFGFRRGYQDLVRLYIGRAEPAGASTVDLYEAFEAVVRDEESFRSQLRSYAVMVDGRPQMTPRDIPPLVSQHLPTISPTAKGKMFNAELVVRRSPGTPTEPTAYPADGPGLAHNFQALLPVLRAADEQRRLTYPQRQGPRGTEPSGEFEAFAGLIGSQELYAALQQHRWLSPDYFRPDLAYLKELTDAQDATDWLVVAPQVGSRTHEIPTIGLRNLVLRTRRRPPLFGPISDPKHRRAVERVVGARPSWGDAYLDDHYRADRGAVLLYLVEEQDKWDRDVNHLVMAFTLFAPKTAHPANGQVVQFQVRDTHDPNAATVPDR